MNNEDLINEQIKIYEEDGRRMRAKFWIIYIFLLFAATFTVVYFFK